jgi:hypothetical protein
MVSEESLIGLYLSLIVYFGILLGSAIWAYRRTERMTRGKDGMDPLSSHYLGGRTFGPLLMSGMSYIRVLVSSEGICIILSKKFTQHYRIPLMLLL